MIKATHQCRSGALITGQILQRWGKRDTADCYHCNMGARLIDTPSHRLLGCSNQLAKAQYILRHNQALHILADSVAHNFQGNDNILIDAGTHEEYSSHTSTSYTIPKWMLPLAERKGSDGKYLFPHKPDMVIIKTKEGQTLPKHTDRYLSGKSLRAQGWTVRIYELAYTWDTNWQAAYNRKQHKYQPLIQALRNKGWSVHYEVILLGATGAVYEQHTKKVLNDLGIQNRNGTDNLDKLLTKLHHHAVTTLTKTVNIFRRLDNHATDRGTPHRPRRRDNG
jgi:hypothetical protein